MQVPPPAGFAIAGHRQSSPKPRDKLHFGIGGGGGIAPVIADITTMCDGGVFVAAASNPSGCGLAFGKSSPQTSPAPRANPIFAIGAK